VDRLVRHCYEKGSDSWKIIKTDVLVYQRVPYDINQILQYSRKIRDNLTTDLLTKKYREENATNPMYGHCYHATQAMFYFLDTDTLVPYRAKDWRGEDHWWLTDKENGFILDVTSDQYYTIGKEPPHDKGKPAKWYGFKGRVHKRTMVLMQRVQEGLAFFEPTLYSL